MKRAIWDIKEQKQLLILYCLGANKGEIALILKRTDIAVDKKLRNLNIRKQLWDLNKKIFRIISPGCDIEVIHKSVNAIYEEHKTQLCDNNIKENIQYLSKHLRSINTIRQNKSLINKATNPLDIWMSDNELEDFVLKYDESIKIYHNINQLPHNRYSYLCNNKPVPQAYILRKANEIARQKNMPSIFLDGLTE